MFLSEYFAKDSILRDGEFSQTMPLWSSSINSLCYLADKRFLPLINQNQCISAVITNHELADKVAQEKSVVLDADPAKAYYELHNHLIINGLSTTLVSGKHISHKASIHPTALIGSNVYIEDNVEIGPHSIVEENTVLKEGTFVGSNVILGARGMQNLRIGGKRFDIMYCGGVTVAANCEILSGSIIQRPYQRFFTEIGTNTQISVRTSVGHGSRIGSFCQIAGGVTIAGNVILGDRVFVGPGSVISDDLTIASNTRILLGSVVGKSIYVEGQTVSGNLAQAHSKQLKNYSKIRNL